MKNDSTGYIRALKILTHTSCLCLITCTTAHANTLLDIYKNFGGDSSQISSNYTAPGGFKDQAAGHYSGGGLSVRQRNMVIQPIQISMPHVGGRCGQMDMFFGSLSYMQAQDLVKFGKAVLQGVPMYAFQLALKTASPQIEGLMSEFMEIVRKLNALYLEQCTATQMIVGGLWPKDSAVSDELCKIATQNANIDIVGAAKHCRESDAVVKAREEMQEKYEDLMTAERNLVWHLLGKMARYKDKNDLKELMMNVSGTLISVKEGKRFRFVYMEPKVSGQEFLSAYLRGGSTQKLKCDEHKNCLKPTLVSETIKEGAKDDVIKKISELRAKYLHVEPMTPDEKDFLGDATTVPVYKYIQVSAATGSQFLTGDAAEYIALSVLLHRFEVMMTEILEAVELISKIQIDDGEINKFKDALRQARSLVIQRNTSTIMQARQMLDQAIRAEEHSVMARNPQ